jgi:hypothetical protein
VDSFDTISKITGKTPIILPLPYTELVYTYDEGLDYMDVTVTYKMQNAKIISYQIWGAEALVSTTSTGYTVYDADHSIYYSIENEEECIHCKRILKDSVLTISVTGNYTIEDIIKLLKDE